ANLVSIVIPNSVKTIGNNAFRGCTSLKEIFTKSYPFLINSVAFNTIYLSELTLYVPSGTKVLYQEADVWKDFGNIIEVDSIVLKQPEAVDLGLSVKWASFNLCAQSPEQYGSYFAWAETRQKSDYSWNTYSFLAGGSGAGATDPEYDEYSIGGSTYKKLKPQYDAAHVILGANWRMPTVQELQELKDNCTWTWDDFKGGYTV
ncbi:MAG TPA: leucine-rich repeat protein, partial [Bacteroidaceae bacterium]|nr:leucine-rich repeat protein [Bacteroidaceae bacterium]